MSPEPIDPAAIGRGRGAPLTRPRPGHADLVGMQKYGFDEARPVLERASARETAARVALGAVARGFLGELGIRLVVHTLAIGPVRVPEGRRSRCPTTSTGSTPIRCAASTPRPPPRMVAEVDAAHKDGDTLGGVVEVLAYGVPPGLGSYVHWDRRLDAQLAAALMGIQAIKGVEVGDGFVDHDPARLRGPRRAPPRRRPHRAGERSRRRHRGRHVDGHRAARARRHEADRDGSARAAHGRRRDRRGGPRAPPALGCLRRARRRASSPRRWSRSCSPTPCSRSSAATRSPRRVATSSPTSRRSPTRSAPRSAVVGCRVRSCLSRVRVPPCPIVLIGRWARASRASGSGSRPSVGAPFIDTDARIVERYGPIDEIFAREGEEYFRILEREVVADALREEAVISLGGGAVLHPDTRDDLADLPVVWLQVSPRGRRAPAGRRHPSAARRGGVERWARSSRRARRSTSRSPTSTSTRRAARSRRSSTRSPSGSGGAR